MGMLIGLAAAVVAAQLAIATARHKQRLIWERCPYVASLGEGTPQKAGLRFWSRVEWRARKARTLALVALACLVATTGFA